MRTVIPRSLMEKYSLQKRRVQYKNKWELKFNGKTIAVKDTQKESKVFLKHHAMFELGRVYGSSNT